MIKNIIQVKSKSIHSSSLRWIKVFLNKLWDVDPLTSLDTLWCGNSMFISCEMLWEKWKLKQLLWNKAVVEETTNRHSFCEEFTGNHHKPAHFRKVYRCVIQHLFSLTHTSTVSVKSVENYFPFYFFTVLPYIWRYIYPFNFNCWGKMINIEVEKKISIIFLYHTLISRIHLTLHFPAFLLQFYIPYFISSFNLLKLLTFNYLMIKRPKTIKYNITHKAMKFKININ
jgi:hypothetical protein